MIAIVQSWGASRINLEASIDTRDTEPNRARHRVLSDAYLSELYRSAIEGLVRIAAPNGVDGLMVIELGAAGGITKELFPTILTTDVRDADGVDVVASADFLPVPSKSVDAVIAKDVFHHVPDVEQHLAELDRVLTPDGKAVYLEPNWNRLSRIIFSRLHPEPFDAGQADWVRDPSDPMDSNQALPWIVFERDLVSIQARWPQFRFSALDASNGIAFLLSGGVHTRTPIPARVLRPISRLESRFPVWLKHVGLNRYVMIERV